MIRFVASALVLILGASVCTTGAPEWRTVYGNQAWYRERAEPEREWRGTLRPLRVIEGPNSRTALRYELATADQSIAVYAPNDALDRFANQKVEVRGKVVAMDIPELWIGSIR
jgi:hypothetical protein